ncbi:MAG: hypothetical protein JXQ84_09825 [Rhodospirillaceae bacterium]|nr:hypothetical protein [Rhodospirillaceae bacterium]
MMIDVKSLLYATFFVGLAVLTASSVKAKDAPELAIPKPDSMMRLFDGTCANNVPYLDRVKSFAQALKWQNLPPEAATLGAPLDPNAKFNGWIVRNDGHLFFVGWSEGAINGRKATTCSVMTKGVSADILTALIGKKYTVRLLDDMSVAYQRDRIWNTTINGEYTLIRLNNSVGAASEAATLSIIFVNVQ